MSEQSSFNMKLTGPQRINEMKLKILADKYGKDVLALTKEEAVDLAATYEAQGKAVGAFDPAYTAFRQRVRDYLAIAEGLEMREGYKDLLT